MFTKAQSSGKKTTPLTQKNTVESLSDLGGGIIDQFLGNNYDSNEMRSREGMYGYNAPEAPRKRESHNLFSFSNYHEKEVVTREIQALTNEIKKMVEMLKSEASELVKDAGKLAVEPISDKPGIYHERFLETILSLLRALRATIGESRTWMQALISKKKKRGSLFASLSKKQGTQYSLSQEHQVTRSVQ